MKREILFRGRPIDNNEWVYGNLIIEYDGTYFIDFWVSELIEPENNYYEMVNKHYEVIPETVGQFTGLTDKNGVKIFEGDIVKVTGGYSGDYKAKERIGIVEYEDNEFYAPCERDGSWWYECEVIGNIHDNPELLK